jgi:TRAP-type mannitol/chloroaromatic compound transport system permease small subunit
LRALLAFAHGIDWLNDKLGRVANWLVLVACLISAGNAFSRYGFNLSSNAWLEVQWYMFAGMVMLGAAWTLNRNEHVRVDILYGALGTRGQVWVDIVGTLVFLVPAMGVMVWTSWGLFYESWRIGEMSMSAGGLVRWPVKLLLPLGFGLVALQGISEIIKRVGYLAGAYNLDVHYERPLQ